MTENNFKKFIGSLICFLLLIFVSFKLFPYAIIGFLNLGLIKEEISISGSGSMYPTFPKGVGESEEAQAAQTVALPQMRRYPSGINLFGKKFFSYDLKHNDIVEFENDKTHKITKEKYGEESGFVKRVVALAGDTVELRDGFVLLNGSPLIEPYTAKPKSTYGGEGLNDCTQMKIPDGHIFVLGDNRKASLDSRFDLGLIPVADVHHVIPWEEQEQYKENWRDASKDASLAHTTSLDAVQFVTLLNTKRITFKIPQYKYNALLSTAAKKRGENMIRTNDFSSEATKSGYTLQQAVEDSGYKNVIFAEIFTKGSYEEEELLDNFLEFPDTQKILFSKEYQDMGLSAVLGEVNGCPVEVVVAHLGGYLPPDYEASEIESWQKLIVNLEDVYPSWNAAKDAAGIDKEKINKLLSLFETRIYSAKKVVTRMKANQWLTDEEKKLVTLDKTLASQMNELIADLTQ